MSVVSLSAFKAYLLEPSVDVDCPLQKALAAGTAETSSFVGFDLGAVYGSSVPSDLEAAIFLLAHTYVFPACVADNESRRSLAQKLMLPYRISANSAGVSHSSDKSEES